MHACMDTVCGLDIVVFWLEIGLADFSPLFLYIYKLVNQKSNTDLGNTQSAPRGGESDCVPLDPG